MRRACKVTLKYATVKKRRHVAALLEAYRVAVNFYIKSLWRERGKLDKPTLARLEHTRLSERYKSQALKQALDVVVSTRKAAKKIKKFVSCPIFKGAAILDAKFVTIEEGRGSFDLIIRLSGLHKGHRLTIPTKRTVVLNKWLGKLGAELLQGCALCVDGIVLWVKLPDRTMRTQGDVLAVDVGVNKLLVDSDGEQYGREFKPIRDKINRRKPGSKGRQRALRERENFFGRIINLLPWGRLKILGVENLKDLKRGKKKNRGKTFRKAIAPWTYRRVLARIGHKAQENRVHLVAVPPAYTSQTCPICRGVDRANRRGEMFLCIGCGYSADADYVGAQNILVRTQRLTGSVESPGHTRSM
jgi:IS605 OrfB family transposase